MINKIFALPVVEQLTPVLSRRQIDGADVIVVDHPRVKASVALNGAHLLSWKPEGEEEGLWLSDATSFKKGAAIRGGVPICWPWFGPSAQQGLPSHGFARNQQWTLKAHNEDDNGAVLTFELQAMMKPAPCGRTISPCMPASSWVKPVKSNWKPTASSKPPLPCTPISTWVTSAQ
jgi:glucose-6-phosphate 1-epimerase